MFCRGSRRAAAPSPVGLAAVVWALAAAAVATAMASARTIFFTGSSSKDKSCECTRATATALPQRANPPVRKYSIENKGLSDLGRVRTPSGTLQNRHSGAFQTGFAAELIELSLAEMPSNSRSWRAQRVREN